MNSRLLHRIAKNPPFHAYCHSGVIRNHFGAHFLGGNDLNTSGLQINNQAYSAEHRLKLHPPFWAVHVHPHIIPTNSAIERGPCGNTYTLHNCISTADLKLSTRALDVMTRCNGKRWHAWRTWSHKTKFLTLFCLIGFGGELSSSACKKIGSKWDLNLN